MAKSSLKIGETHDVDKGSNPDELQISKATLEETPHICINNEFS